jgi:hypothetical protein
MPRDCRRSKFFFFSAALGQPEITAGSQARQHRGFVLARQQAKSPDDPRLKIGSWQSDQANVDF